MFWDFGSARLWGYQFHMLRFYYSNIFNVHASGVAVFMAFIEFIQKFR
jgi:hypothetical protein